MMTLKHTWPLFAALTFLGLFTAVHAHAIGGMITVQQVSNTRQLGTWIISTPRGKTYADHRGEYLQKIEPVTGGTYALSVDAPRKATTSITVYRSNNEVIRSVEDTKLAFTVPEGEAVRVVITYRFFGTIVVESAPNGQPFLLQGSNTVTYTGETPARFQNVPPLYYTVQYGHKEGCRSPRKQSRLLDPNESLTFYGVYECGPTITLGERKPPSVQKVDMPVAEESEEQRTLELALNASQTEVLPGAAAHYTLSIQNKSRSTLTNLTVSVQLDPEQGTIVGTRDGGTQQGNVVSWNIDKIYAGKMWSTQFAMKANENLAVGEQIALTARAASPGLVESGASDQELTSTSSIGVVLLPQTGSRVELVLAALLSVAALILAISIRLRTQVAFFTV